MSDGKPERDICPLDIRWAAFLLLNSGDISIWGPLFRRLILGDDPDDNDDDDWGRPKVPAPRPLEPAS